MTSLAPTLTVIDPAVKIAELDCFNRIATASPVPATYHLPALFGLDSLATAAKPAGIVILGSASSVHDRLPWQTPLEDWVRARMDEGIPVLGLCYGHQMIAHILGGEVRYLYENRKKCAGFRPVRLDATALWGAATGGPLYVSHREVVATCPASMIVVGRSDEVAIEALAHRSLPVWTLQPHPEATTGFLKNRGDAAPGEGAFAFGWNLVGAFLARVGAATGSPPPPARGNKG